MIIRYPPGVPVVEPNMIAGSSIGENIKLEIQVIHLYEGD